MTVDIERWMMGDPARVYERLESQRLGREERLPSAKTERARQNLEKLFGEDEMGRKINIPGHILNAMYAWGDWAKRPQFWQNLNATPFYRLLELPGGASREVQVKLDPLSHQIHRAVMRLESRMEKAALFIYFVRGETYDDHKELFNRFGVTYTRFIEAVKTGSHSAYREGVRKLDQQLK